MPLYPYLSVGLLLPFYSFYFFSISASTAAVHVYSPLRLLWWYLQFSYTVQSTRLGVITVASALYSIPLSLQWHESNSYLLFQLYPTAVFCLWTQWSRQNYPEISTTVCFLRWLCLCSGSGILQSLEFPFILLVYRSCWAQLYSLINYISYLLIKLASHVYNFELYIKVHFWANI